MIKYRYLVKFLKIICTILLFIISIILVILSSPSIFHIFSFALLILTIGTILDAQKTGFCTILKYILYISYFIYTIFALGLFEWIYNFQGVTLQDWDKILYGIIAPLCLIIVLKIILNKKIKGHKIFNYFIIWIIFIIFGIIWDILYPADIILEFLILYWVISLLIVLSIKKKG